MSKTTLTVQIKVTHDGDFGPKDVPVNSRIEEAIADDFNVQTVEFIVNKAKNAAMGQAMKVVEKRKAEEKAKKND